MSDQPPGGSLATRFHDVVVTHDQSGGQWRARRAEIRAGRVCILDVPPGGFLDHRAGTFTITAVDGAGRSRKFDHLSLASIDESTAIFT